MCQNVISATLSLPGVRGPGADGLLPGQTVHLLLLRVVVLLDAPHVPPGVSHNLLQDQEHSVHDRVGAVLHLDIELDHLPADVAGPVGDDGGSDGVRLEAEAAQRLVVSEAPWSITRYRVYRKRGFCF